ncbi:MAG TPA: hypothetical protein VJ885_17125 [Thermoanaerobaculia bacterium]|nr:hypothetical protein [Thermoanaerobaculia bacterium]
MTLVSSGAGSNYGLRAAGGSPWIEEATIRVQGGELGYGIVVLSGLSHLTVKRTLIEVTGSSAEVYGILLANTSDIAEVRDVQIMAASSGASCGICLIEFMIKLEPGIFDLGSTRLIMKPYVDIEGSGQEASVIQGGGAADQLDGVVRGASFAELRHLQVKCVATPSLPVAIPVFLSEGVATRLTNVTLHGAEGTPTTACARRVAARGSKSHDPGTGWSGFLESSCAVA